MPFGLYNTPATFQMCMMAIFTNIVEHFLEVFMDNVLVVGDSYDDWLSSLPKVLKCVKRITLSLIRKIVILWLRRVSSWGTEHQDEELKLIKKKVDVIEKLPPHLKRQLITTPIIVTPDWSSPFELMCDANDFAVGAIMGQWRNKDRKGVEIYVVDHLPRLEQREETILFLSIKIFWISISSSGIMQPEISYQERKKLLHNTRYYFWEKPFLFKQYADQMIRRCVAESENYLMYGALNFWSISSLV
ncbi:Retrovirus-related Pol polyprotein from transposon 297 family [Gossypium australe]|uniref:Retrovirus-related Pol polyprotein from transposon 297 family n=1 Tax=Gossypium australe TaxID=47621 RepID=A0A5B6VLR3_9ROSI|nr:Retrovirus-related Pol polyprotein from transposon 297 family [Gossypium australe]